MLAQALFRISGSFPDLGLRSKSVDAYSKILEVDGTRYISLSLLVSALAGLCASFAFHPDLLTTAAVFLSAFAAAFFILLRLPESEVKRRAVEMEAELPLLLRALAMLLDMGVPFLQALNAASQNGRCNSAFDSALREVEDGAGLPKALARLAERSGSPEMKKAVVQIISAYEHGGKGGEIRRIADDLIAVQRYRIRDFASKSAMFGLLFVISATVVPTFFLVFSTAGRLALDTEMSPAVFMFVFVALLPLVNLAIAAIAGSQMPPATFRKEVGQVPLLLFGVAAALALVMLADVQIAVKLAAFVIVGAGSALLLWKEYEGEERLERVERALPDALLAVSGLPKSYGIEKIFERMGDLGNAVSEEARKTARQLHAGLAVDKALEDLWKRNSSQVLKRMCDLMLGAQLAGANVSERMHELAEDLIMFAELERERENALSVQKYTLIMGAALVPLILAVSLSLSSQIALLLGQQNSEVVASAPGAISAYIVLYSAVAAFYISETQGKRSGMLPYFAAMAALGLACFYIVSQQFV